MTRNDLKYFVTALLFVDLCSIAVLGLLMAFVIPAGNVPMESKVFLGLHRSKRADIHVTLSLSLLGLIAWHIWLSREWVTGSAKKLFGEQWQKALWILSGGWLAVVFLAWLVVKLQ
jgi:hypothetical protein